MIRSGNEAVAAVVGALEGLEIDYMLAGSYSSNYYGIPRATQDADFVVTLEGSIGRLAERLGEAFELDPQASFESVTGTFRDIFLVPSVPFKIEVFHLSADAHDQARFKRRRRVRDDGLGLDLFVPAVEDVIVMKLRWEKRGKRGKDASDIRDVIAVQGEEVLDWDYIGGWTEVHGTGELLEEIRASIPPLD